MIFILGFGEQGRAIAHYVEHKTDEKIIALDKNHKDTKYEFYQVANLSEALAQILLKGRQDESTLIYNCLPVSLILEATKWGVGNGFNIVDLAGDVKVEKEQMKLSTTAKKTNSVVIRAGLAPGIVSSFASYFNNKFGAIGVRAFCGGIPKYPEHPFGYIRVFYEGGVIKEYTGVAEVIENGRLIKKPTLSEREYLHIPSLGILEADLTSGGISTTYNEIELDYFEYKTLRYPGHFQYVKDNILNQPDPTSVLSNIIEPVSADNPDIIILHLEFETFDGISCYDYFWEYDYENNISAMAQATGYIAGEVGLRSRNMDPGIYNMDSFDPYSIRKSVREIRQEGNFSKLPIIF